MFSPFGNSINAHKPINDHKPMESFLNNLIHKTQSRIQEFIIFLQKYNLVVNYVSGNDLICSHTLSRVLLKEQSWEISETEINWQIHLGLSSSSISTERLKQLKVETLNEKALDKVARYCETR